MKTALLLGVLALGLGGCKALLYVPETHVVPLFEGPGQLQAAAGLNLDGPSARVAVSPLPHAFLFGAGSLGLEGERYGHRHAEAGAGLYAGLGWSATAEVLAGTGWGRSEGNGERFIGLDPFTFLPLYEDYRYEAASQRSYVQLNLGRRLREGAIEVGAALRLARVRFDDFATEPAGLTEGFRGTFVEPGWLFRARLSTHLDLDVQGGYSFAADQEGGEAFRRRASYGNVGVRLRLGR